MDKWWLAPHIDRRTYLLGEYQRLQMSEQEFLMILMMDYAMSIKPSMTTRDLAELMKLEESVVMDRLSEMMNKGWIEMKVSNKKIEYSLQPVFLKKPIMEIPRTLFDLFEEHFARPLTSKEMEKLSGWMQQYDNALIEWGLRKAVVYKRISFSYIDKILNRWYLNGITAEMLDRGEE